MNPETFPIPEEFDPKSMFTKIESVIDELRENIDKSGSEVSEADESFYTNILNTVDAISRDKSVRTREDFIRAVNYRAEKNTITFEDQDFIINNTRE